MNSATRRVISVTSAITVMMLLIVLISGCSQATQGSAGGTQSKKLSETITVLAEKHPWTTAIQPYIPEFEKQTGIKVNLNILSEQQQRAKSLMTLQAKSPDIDVFMSLKSLEGLAYEKAGFYESLDKYIKDPTLTPADYKINDFMKGPYDGERIEGKLVGIPIIVEGPVIFYRKDLFAEYNIPIPKTLNDLVAAAKTVEQKSNGHVYGIALRGLPPAVCYDFGPFFHNMGLEWLDKNGSLNFDKPGAVTAINTYCTLAAKYGPPGAVNNNFYQDSSLFAQGKVAMELDSSNELASIIDPSNSKVIGKIGVFAIPAGPGGNHPTVLQWGISMSAYSQHKDAAWKFIRWATSPEMQLKLALKGIASPRASTWDNAKFKASLKSTVKKEWAKTLEFILKNGNPEVGPPAVKEAEVRQVIGNNIDQVILGSETPQAAANKIQQQAMEVIK
ncbi:putative ABC transporter-binding protein precursor [Peptococcaceae bacterium CEB3]|nr:putative ABC transporter-binding protein precursor [Peptococcaceae bacterium CEB3]